MSHKLHATLLVVALLGISMAVGAASSGEVWVDASKGPAGNVPDCGTSQAPCGTIRYAMGTHKEGELDVVLVAGGVFSDPDDLNLVVTAQNVSFRASGSEAPTVIDCKGLGRFINVTNPDTTERSVLTLGLHALTFENCLSPGTTDGGVVLTWGIVSSTVTDCRFTSNSAMNGGAFAILYKNNPQPIRRPQLLISGDNGFSNNRATINGGAIYARYAQVTVTGTHFENNTAQSGGGIHWLSPFMLTVKNSAFRSCSAETTGPDGGNAIYATSSGSVEVDDVTFSNNRAFGTLAFIFGTRAVVTNCLFENNRAARGGGAIYGGPFTRIAASSIRMIGNSASRGAGIALYSGHVDGSKLTFERGTAAFGGAMYFSQSQSTITESTFTSNWAEKGAATFATVRSDLKFKTNTFDSNQALNCGGAVYCDKSVYLFENKQTFRNNTAGGPSHLKYALQDVFCDTAEAIGYCHIEGDQTWIGKCVNYVDHSPKIPIPNWLKGVFIGLGVLIFLLIVSVAFWIYRVRMVYKANMASGVYEQVGDEQGTSLLDDDIPGSAINDDADDLEIGSSRPNNPFDVITNPNRVQSASIHHQTDPDIDDDGLLD